MTTASDIVREADGLRARAVKISGFRAELRSGADVYVKSRNMRTATFPAADYPALSEALDALVHSLEQQAEALEARIRLVDEGPS